MIFSHFFVPSRHLISSYLLDVVIVETEEFDPFAAVAEDRLPGSGEGGRAGSDNEGTEDWWDGRNGTMKMIFMILKGVLEILLDIMI